MNKKITITFAIVAIITAGIGGLFINSSEYSTSHIVKTDPKYFTNLDYVDAIHAQYITINPTEIKDLSYTVFSGTIQNIAIDSVLMAPIDPEIIDEQGNIIEPRADVVTFTISIDQKTKGEGIGKTINVSSSIPSKIDYQIGDTVIVMATKNLDKYRIMSGPYGMYKILNDEAIGHEFTLPKHVLLD